MKKTTLIRNLSCLGLLAVLLFSCQNPCLQYLKGTKYFSILFVAKPTDNCGEKCAALGINGGYGFFIPYFTEGMTITWTSDTTFEMNGSYEWSGMSFDVSVQGKLDKNKGTITELTAHEADLTNNLTSSIKVVDVPLDYCDAEDKDFNFELSGAELQGHIVEVYHERPSCQCTTVDYTNTDVPPLLQIRLYTEKELS